MILYDSAYAPNPFTVRLFIAERKGLKLQLEQIDVMNLENRGERYVRDVSARGEVPALRLDDGSVITEIIAICEYLDEISSDPRSLIGTTPKERAETRMWTRRAFLEIAQPIDFSWRSSEMAIGFYRGHRILPPTSAQEWSKRLTEHGLGLLEGTLAKGPFIAGERFTLADILLFAFMSSMSSVVPWVHSPERRNVSAWYQRMSERPSVAAAKESFSGPLSV
jgi:glutathione S-transferase